MLLLPNNRPDGQFHAGRARELSAKAARRARIQAIALLPLTALVLVVYHYRIDIFGVDTPIKIAPRLR